MIDFIIIEVDLRDNYVVDVYLLMDFIGLLIFIGREGIGDKPKNLVHLFGLFG
jgi:hypothetical protein